MSRDFKAGLIVASVLWLLGIFAVGHFARAFGQDWFVGSGYAYHLDRQKHCNSFTAGFGVEHHVSESVRLAGGAYDNSNCRVSNYAAAVWMPLRAAEWSAGVIGGVVTGYRSAVTPAGGGVISYERRRWGANAILIPPTGDSGRGVVWLQFKLPW